MEDKKKLNLKDENLELNLSELDDIEQLEESVEKFSFENFKKVKVKIDLRNIAKEEQNRTEVSEEIKV